MPVKLNKFALAGIGAAELARQKVESLFEGASSEKVEDEPTTEDADAKSFNERLDDMIELGEEKYDELVGRIKEERGKISGKLQDRIGGIFSEIGLVTKEELEAVEAKIKRLERKAKAFLS